jgi:hypothetical protein
MNPSFNDVVAYALDFRKVAMRNNRFVRVSFSADLYSQQVALVMYPVNSLGETELPTIMHSFYAFDDRIATNSTVILS